MMNRELEEAVEELCRELEEREIAEYEGRRDNYSYRIRFQCDTPEIGAADRSLITHAIRQVQNSIQWLKEIESCGGAPGPKRSLFYLHYDDASTNIRFWGPIEYVGPQNTN